MGINAELPRREDKNGHVIMELKKLKAPLHRK